MIRKIKTLAFYSLALFALVSCAQEVSESSNEIQKRILDSYLAVYYPDVVQESSGLTYLEKIDGTGDEVVEDLNAVYIQYSTRTLAGEYSSYNIQSLAEWLGTYAKTTYYGPTLFEVGYGTTYIGLEEIFLGMKKGAKVTAIVPPWLTTTESSSSQSNSTNIIYDIELIDIITDIEQYQIDSMESYANLYLNGLDSTSYGYYFQLDCEPTLDSLGEDETVSIRYVGRLLDGFVFDTNIMDSAKVNGIYSSDNSYDALEVTYYEDLDTFVDNSSLVTGFCMAIQQMCYEESATTMFISDYGYSYYGSGSIGAYQPLIFNIYLEPKEEDDDDDDE